MSLINPNYRLSMIHPHRGGVISNYLLSTFSKFQSPLKSANINIIEALQDECLSFLLICETYKTKEFDDKLFLFLQCFLILYQNCRFKKEMCVKLLNQFILLSKWAMKLRYNKFYDHQQLNDQMKIDFIQLNFDFNIRKNYDMSIDQCHLLCFLDGVCCVYIKLMAKYIPSPGFTGDVDFIVVMHNATVYMLEMHLLSNNIICYDCVPVYCLFNRMFRYAIVKNAQQSKDSPKETIEKKTIGDEIIELNDKGETIVKEVFSENDDLLLNFDDF